MASEIFRFVNLRGTVRTQLDDAPSIATVSLSSDEPSALASELGGLRESGADRASYEAVAAAFVRSDQFALASALPVDIGKLDIWFGKQPAQLSPERFAAGVHDVLGADVAPLVGSAAYVETRRRISDSLLALTVHPGSAQDKGLLTRYMRLCGLLETFAANPDATIDRNMLSRMRVLLPAAIFPLPPLVNPRDATDAKAFADRQTQLAADEQAMEKLAQRIEDSQNAIVELSSALRADTNDLRQTRSQPAPAAPTVAARRRTSAAAEAAPGSVALVPSVPVSAGVLSAKGVGRLSAATTKALGALGVSTDFVDVPYAVQSLEAVIAEASAQLFQGRNSRVVTRIGNRWIPRNGGSLMPGFMGDWWSTPGPCAVPTSDDPGGGVTVPSTTTSAIRPVGVADLLVVRQEVKRYEMGEIAHIENVMKSENRQRKHREITKTTETITTETETTTEESHDLETTNRYELQQESDAVIKEESSRNISLSISGSYGPFASGTANISSSQGDSKENTTKNAMNFAHDVTDKAVKKVQSRVLERRTVTTMHEVADISHHGFDNTQGQQHIQGVYRWLDKVYSAQVTSYGLRLMFELVVPEPSAFYRYALTSAPPEGLTVELPDPPGYCHHPSGTFVPLTPGDLAEGNYQFWVSKYAVSGVEPPPPLNKTIGITLMAEPASGEDFVIINNNDLTVPSGYAAERAWAGGQLAVYDGSTPPAFMSFRAGRTELGFFGSGPMNGEDSVIPVSGEGWKVAAFSATIEVLCTRTAETLAAWQLTTFNAIIGAYNDLKSQYDAALARLELNAQSGTGVVGKNPATNRETERRELKRQSISLLTNQQYDLFDAMRRGVPPYGYPQMNIADAMAEGGYIQFFEQAFEWVNMTYLFYPYFWARKSEWPNYLRQDDTDPLFAQFLEAGAARVQLPVTPGFEQAVLYLLQTGNAPWEEDDSAYQIQGSLYQSMVDEIVNEQLGSFNRGQGTIAVTQGDTTIKGTGTAFDAGLHLDREIMIAYRTYRVIAVVSPTEVTLDRGYIDVSATGVPYSFGGRLVGDPWEVKLPTDLVFLQTDSTLPDFTNS